MVNQTVNISELAGIGSMGIENPFMEQVAERLAHLILAPYLKPDMIWMIVPLAITLLMMTFYFGKYEYEELGWNTAVGNSLVLMFISVDLLRHIYNGVSEGMMHPGLINFELNPIKTWIALGLGCIALILLISNFEHWLPKKLSFFISSNLPINMTAYVAMTIVYTNVVFDRFTLIASLFLFVMLMGIIQLIKLIERSILYLTTDGEVVLLPKTKMQRELMEKVRLAEDKDYGLVLEAKKKKSDTSLRQEKGTKN